MVLLLLLYIGKVLLLLKSVSIKGYLHPLCLSMSVVLTLLLGAILTFEKLPAPTYSAEVCCTYMAACTSFTFRRVL